MRCPAAAIGWNIRTTWWKRIGMACPAAFRLTVRRQCAWTLRQERSTSGSIALRWLSSTTDKDGLIFAFPRCDLATELLFFRRPRRVLGTGLRRMAVIP